MGRLILITGGTSSGKSAYAEQLCKKYPSVAYIATGLDTDAEMSRRIARHRARRNPSWRTVEAPAQAWLAAGGVTESAALLDSVSSLVGNKIYEYSGDAAPTPGQCADVEAQISLEVNGLLDAITASSADFIVVTDEVGLGMVSFNAQGRLFGDLLGRANQALALASDEAWLLIAGLPLRLK